MRCDSDGDKLVSTALENLHTIVYLPSAWPRRGDLYRTLNFVYR